MEAVSPRGFVLPAEQDVFPKDSSLRAEVDRILEFSRTVGLCNYSTSPSQDVPAPLTYHVDSEPGVGLVPLLSL
jgi:hypothetical protein